MSTLEVNNIKDTGSNSLISSDGSGTFTINNSVLKNTPAFFATSSSTQTVTGSTWTKVQCGNEILDSDSAYDNSTNYRFTVPTGEGGKYMVFGQVWNYHSSTGIYMLKSAVYKNGSKLAYTQVDLYTAHDEFNEVYVNLNAVINLSAGDYIELYGNTDGTADTPEFRATSTHFGAYKLIGA